MLKKLSIAILLLLPLMAWFGIITVKDIVFDIHCEGHLKRAADANTIELASKEVKIALDYMEEKKLTKGFTSVIYKTPDEDVGFWYQNIKSAFEELINLKPETPPLEKSNVLMKLRETLLDQEGGVKVTEPTGITLFPYNKTFCFLGWISLVIAVIGVIWILIIIDL